MNPTEAYAIFCTSCVYVLAHTHIVTQNGIENGLPKNIALLDLLMNLEQESKILDTSDHEGSVQDWLSQTNLTEESRTNLEDFEEAQKSLIDFLLMLKGKDDIEKRAKRMDHEKTGEQKRWLNPDGYNLADRFSASAMHAMTKPRRVTKKIKETIQSDTSYQDSLLDLPALVVKHGFHAKEYTVQTEDGYILGLHRMWKGKTVGDPVLLMHGLLQSGDCWLGAGPGLGLAYLLAADGHDVWLGNVRGNHYSRAHVTLDPGSSSFWQFCADEHGKFDLPAIIDKVLNETGSDKLNYVGYSQGGGIYHIMCSELPHYCGKANVVIGLSPSGRHIMTRSLLFRFVCVFFEENEKVLHDAEIYEVLQRNGFARKFLNFFCRKSDLTFQVCELMKDLLDSPHPGSFSKASMFNMASNFLSGTSVHNMARYGQSLRSKSIYKFDYGNEKNMQLYGSPKPPKYNLKAVTVPVVVIYGRNDGIVDKDDVKWLVHELPNVVEAYEVEDVLWTHLDGTYSQYIPRLLYPKIKEHLNKNR